MKQFFLNKLFIVLILLISSFSSVYGLIFIPHSHKPKPNYNYHNGYCVTFSNDTIIGSIKFSGIFLTFISVKSNGKETKKIKMDQISFLQLASSDSTFNQTGVTKFYNIRKNNSVYRLVYEGVQNNYFDNSYYIDENNGFMGNRFFVFNKKNIIIKKITPLISIKKSFISYFSKGTNLKINSKNYNGFMDVIKKFDY